MAPVSAAPPPRPALIGCRWNEPGETQAEGEWSEEEIQRFVEVRLCPPWLPWSSSQTLRNPVGPPKSFHQR